MHPLTRDELLAVVRARHDDHPWARLCQGPAMAWVGAWDLGDAVVWRSGHPWDARAELHALGPPAAVGRALVAAGVTAREGVITPADTVPAPALGLGGGHRWDVRMRYGPGSVLPGEERVGWLPATAGVDALLDAANPHAAIRPGDLRGGRWCGVRDRDGGDGGEGRLVAVAVETVLAPVPHLSSLAVHPAARRRGLGQAVTSWFVRAAFAAGAREVMLATDRGNDAAAATYDALGFDAWPMAGFGG